MRLQEWKCFYYFRPHRALNTAFDILTTCHVLVGVEFLEHVTVVTRFDDEQLRNLLSQTNGAQNWADRRPERTSAPILRHRNFNLRKTMNF